MSIKMSLEWQAQANEKTMDLDGVPGGFLSLRAYGERTMRQNRFGGDNASSGGLLFLKFWTSRLYGSPY